MFSLAASKDWEVNHVDVKTAFVNAKMDKDMYINPPDGVEGGSLEEVCRLNLPLYGTKQARRL